MEKKINFLKIDYTIQKVLLILTVVAIPTFYFFFIPFLLLGFWQVVSGLYGVIKLKSKLHNLYIGLVIPYLFSMFFLMEPVMDNFYGLVLFYLIMPFCSAIWYFRLTKTTWNELKGKTQLYEFEMENILDSEELFS